MRVVLDTNVLISALLFRHGRLAFLHEAWRTGKIIPLLCRLTIEELFDTLSKPKFKLPAGIAAEKTAEIVRYAAMVDIVPPLPIVPACRDPKDEIFMVLARVANADALVTGDADLLVLADQFDVPILTPEAFRVRLGV
jgi:uncharacterized protein